MSRFEISCWIFFYAFLAYLVMTAPALLFFIIYYMSAGIALVYGILCTILFWLFFTLLSKTRIASANAYKLLLMSLPAWVAISLQVFGWTGHWILDDLFAENESIWNSGPFLLFPLLAVIAGWIAIHRSRKRIFRQFLKREYGSHT